MNKFIVICLFALPAATAFAGPDWSAIEHGRKLRAQQVATAASAASTTADMSTCRVAPLVQWVDHGPRPHVSPAHNRALRERHASEEKRCAVLAQR